MSNPPPSRDRQSNAATYLALFGVLFIGGAILAVTAIVFPNVLAILFIAAFVFVPAAFHYVIWGRWLSKLNDNQSNPDDQLTDN